MTEGYERLPASPRVWHTSATAESRLWTRAWTSKVGASNTLCRIHHDPCKVAGNGWRRRCFLWIGDHPVARQDV
jgi:hypothetical protein